MKIQTTILGPFGYLSQQPDGEIQSRPVDSKPGLYEWFMVDMPAPAVTNILPITSGLSYQSQFMAWVSDKPFGQQTLLDLQPTLLAHGWKLEKPNAENVVTKLYTPDGSVYRVGFGEGHWVWLLEYTPK